MMYFLHEWGLISDEIGQIGEMEVSKKSLDNYTNVWVGSKLKAPKTGKVVQRWLKAYR